MSADAAEGPVDSGESPQPGASPASAQPPSTFPPPVALPIAPPKAEAVQELGRTGVAKIKRWLEATTHIEMNLNVYDNDFQCSLEHMLGEKHFDLVGYFIKPSQEPIAVEAKRYSSASNQYKYFTEFLATAYSITHREKKQRGNYHCRHYYWVTFHPFALKRWKKLESHVEMAKAVRARPDIFPATEAIDDELLREVASRVAVLVYNKKQGKLSLTREEVKLVHTVLKRKESNI